MYKLKAIMSSSVSDLLTRRELLFSLVNAFGSPLYIILPSEFERNISLFREVFVKHEVAGRIWYAYKVNKTRALLEVAARQSIGVEVSSLPELRLALGHGVPGNQIGVSGPLKDARFLLLGMQHQCTIVLDSLKELKTISTIARSIRLPYPTKVIVRLSGFEISTTGRSEPAPPAPENSRFGISHSDISEIYQMLSEDDVNNYVDLVGFGFHIDNHSVRDRGEALGFAIEQILYARSLGYTCSDIDIGGGFSVQYVRSEDWESFLNKYAASVRSRQQSVMFRNKSFGLIFKDGKRINRGNFYPYSTEAYKHEFLESVLSYRPKGQQHPLSKSLQSHNIRLTIEPGKSLVDQTGMIICTVKGLKRSSRGDQLLVCEMNISHLFEQMIGSEFAVDPILIIAPSSVSRPQTTFSCHIAGNLCLESDILAWRKIWFDFIPQKGDLLAFVNTAGYQMDFVESKIHQMPLPERVIAYQRANNWMWKMDEQFSAIDLLSEE